ncbi:hypothetical protein ACO0LF_27510 [Undibacterium sp. Di27W]|uniref:hypothetical protein n=1 Tax=Undibacterium sp. Di27W TaxID=3413036 RepID=UPI003BF340C3
MTDLYALLIASLAWLIWIPTAVLEKSAKGDMGSVSIFPIIPLFPLLAWGLAYMLDQLHAQLGTMLVVSMHLFLLLTMLVSAAKSLKVLNKK